LAIDFFKEKTDLISEVKVGDMITVYINTRVNESKTQPGRYFNSISGRRLEAGSSEGTKKEEGDDLPF
jgi:hypothetical protein